MKGNRIFTIILLLIVTALAGGAIYLGYKLQEQSTVAPTNSSAATNGCPTSTAVRPRFRVAYNGSDRGWLENASVPASGIVQFNFGVIQDATTTTITFRSDGSMKLFRGNTEIASRSGGGGPVGISVPTPWNPGVTYTLRYYATSGVECASTTITLTAAATATPTPTPSGVVCNSNNVTLTVSPSSPRVGQQVTFSLTTLEGNTFIEDAWSPSGGVDCTGGVTSTASKTCMTLSAGNYSWQHSWRKCEVDFDHCSEVCSRTINYTIQPVNGTPLPTATNPPTGGGTNLPATALIDDQTDTIMLGLVFIGAGGVVVA